MQPSISELRQAPHRFALEPCSFELIEELIPLLHVHYKTVAHYQDIALDPDYDGYLKLHELGMLRIFTAREETGSLIGYAIFFVRPNLHYRKSLQAVQDVLFIHPEKRGFGRHFIAWCDAELRREGVQAVYHHVKNKPELNFSPLLAAQGYELVDLIMAKRLDLPGGA